MEILPKIGKKVDFWENGFNPGVTYLIEKDHLHPGGLFQSRRVDSHVRHS